MQVDNFLRVGTTSNDGRFQVNNLNTVFGSNATAGRFNSSHNGSESTYGVLTTASNSGTGNTYGLYSIASNTNPNGVAHAIRADAYDPEDWAIYSIGNNYFSGEIKIGTFADPYSGDYEVVIDGDLLVEEVRVQNSSNWPDFVFADNYELMPLSELEQLIEKNHHLPDIPSAQKVQEDGVLVGEIQKLLLQKIEELTLYAIEQQKQIDLLNQELTLLKSLNK